MYDARQHKAPASRTLSSPERRGAYTGNMKNKIVDARTSFALQFCKSIQCRAFIEKSKQLLTADHSEINSEAIILESLTTEEYNALNDPFNRYYNDEQEFRNHFSGKPVDCGLIKDQCVWIRLPFSQGFFVLGEQHNFINALSILNVCNRNDQGGKVLLENGFVPYKHWENKEYKAYHDPKTNLGSNVYSIESIYAKLYSGLEILEKDNISKQANIYKIHDYKKKASEDDGRIDDQRKKWIMAANEQKRQVYRSINIPALVFDNEYYPMQTMNANEYLIDAIHRILKQILSEQDPDASTLRQYIQSFFDGPNDIVAFLNFNCIYDEVKKLAEDEFTTSQLDPIGKDDPKRNAYMLGAIKYAAEEKSYVMASIGNSHLSEIEEELRKCEIKYIRHNEFLNSDKGTQMIDAFQPESSTLPLKPIYILGLSIFFNDQAMKHKHLKDKLLSLCKILLTISKSEFMSAYNGYVMRLSCEKEKAAQDSKSMDEFIQEFKDITLKIKQSTGR